MSNDSTSVWTPPAKIEELFAAAAGNKFASINAPTAGPRVEKDLPVGRAPIQLYSLGTPNGRFILHAKTFLTVNSTVHLQGIK